MKRVSVLLGISIAILFSTFSFLFALAAPYFEFNPDYAQSMLVASAPGAVSEVFLPLNEYMAGFDLWVSNGSTSGPVTFTLYSPSDTVMAVRTLTIPAIADSENGTRFTVNLLSQLPVNGALAHRIAVATNVPSLRLYYAQQSRIITHNGVPMPPYTGGLARIGSEDQGFSFKFALTENSETSPPQLSGVTVRQPSIGTVVLDFNANEPVDAQVQYNASLVPFSGQYSSCQPTVVPCSSTLSVTPGVDYSYTLTVKDVWGNESSTTGQFTASGTPPDATPTPTPSPTPSVSGSTTPTPSAPSDASAPVISNLRTANVTTSSATIAWTTNEAANSLAIIQSLPFLINAGGGSDGTLEFEHLITVGGLISDTLFQARVTSSDVVGNSTVATVSFQTLSALATPPPGNPTPTPSTPTNPTPTPTVSVGPPDGSGSSEVTWTPPAGPTPTDGYRVDIIGADGKLIRTIRTKGTSADVGSIPDGATVVVYSDNDGLFEKVGVPTTVRHASLFERLLSALPYILGGLIVAIAVTVGALAWRQRKKTPSPTSPPVQLPRSGA